MSGLPIGPIAFVDISDEMCPFFQCVNCRAEITAFDKSALMVWKNFTRPQFIVLHTGRCFDEYTRKGRLDTTKLYTRGLNTFLDQLNYNTRKLVPMS